ncbi:MAG: carbon-nitrogen hydrolase family protein [Candidatus Aminicenantes bacterium]|nr:MAG: carbon-nitrogen hydrolase family protein [Candidatus Aminicenantes bacterium]
MIKQPIKVGIIQSSPVYLDIKKSMDKALSLMEKAVKQDAELLVFGETWLSGYPAWLDHCPEAALWDHEPTKNVFAKMIQNSITIPGKETKTLCDFAQTHKVVITTGVNEIIPTGPGNGTIYNTLLTINANGEIVNHHRKLMPTFTEKLLYGTGDGHGLKAAETHLARIGGLICWEHWMPLARQALHNSGEHIHIAVWPWVHEMHQIASRHYAFEGRCFVIAVGQIMRTKDFPKELKLPKHLENKPNELILKGGSCIIAPDGKYILEPQLHTEDIIVQEIHDLQQIYKERMTLDTSGHYNRPDIFNFNINTERKK